jgi:hypothetical protein
MERIDLPKEDPEIDAEDSVVALQNRELLFGHDPK